jgi:hypothetical protein
MIFSVFIWEFCSSTTCDKVKPTSPIVLGLIPQSGLKGRLLWDKIPPPLTANARGGKKSRGPRNKAGRNTSVPPSWIFRFKAPPFAAYTSLRFAGVLPKNPPRNPAVCAPPKAASRTLLSSHSRDSATLCWLGQEGSLGAERFASTEGRSSPRG